ncbi:hypothetical protein CLG96_02610 [Sphingomonas oleivorans]|uniref:Uncharacterized protein n=1 Tax=Sphingomonas oleivorans TaxID=1735121 RepID=A0A2T5G1R8_9SPHN|nr:hypothetical protein [Sphingomonas oleivorans]PTQ13050.1 hypothetical protein CLG96_02610 [Sphingomonas oleivorans]
MKGRRHPSGIPAPVHRSWNLEPGARRNVSPWLLAGRQPTAADIWAVIDGEEADHSLPHHPQSEPNN